MGDGKNKVEGAGALDIFAEKSCHENVAIRTRGKGLPLCHRKVPFIRTHLHLHSEDLGP